MRKKLLIGLLALVALLLIVVLSGRWWLGRSAADPARDASIAGLQAPVEVWRDSLGVPHVWARNEDDLFRAMGYVHAQDRLFQMELFRRVADGRMAEILGENLVNTDRFLRTIGMGRAAAENEARLDPAHRRLLQAYADGVNAWIGNHPGPLPPEFVTLRFKPEPWTVRNSLSIAKIMAWDLADWNVGLEVQRALDAVGDSLGRDVLPFYPDSGLTILGGDADWEGRGAAPPAQAAPAAALPRVSGVELPDVPQLALELLETASASHASNSWVIGGSRTRSGKPILANDMHLALRAPAIWYLAALHGGPFDVTGMTLPGVPVVVAGHSRRVAWGYTNAMVDDVDLFVEQVDSANPNRYRTPEGWAEMTVRQDTIRVKGKAPVVQAVRATRHGPVISDVDERGGTNRVIAMQWTAYAPSTEVAALFEMNRARNADEFLQAVSGFNNPHQNVVYADADGQFGYWMAGRVPIRRGGDGVLPVPGWTGEGDWTGWLRFNQHPHVRNPADGFVVTANNRQVGSQYPHHITANWAEPWRAVRIRQMVEAGRDLTAADVLAQQMDVRDAWALRHLPRAVRAADNAGLADAAHELRAWNGEARVDSRGAALFYVWFEELRTRVGSDEFRGKPVYFPRTAMERVLARGGGPWVDDVTTDSTETLDGLAAAAMRTAVERVGEKRWGDLHVTRIDHPMGVVSVLDRAFGLNIGPFPNGGAFYTVNVSGWGGRTPPFNNAYGSSQRHVVDMADPDGSGGFVIPTGQSGNPYSPHYRDQTPMWREGRLWLIPLDRGKAEARAVSRMTLRPGM
ncbi:penicillin acylase family protein [Longimicrobium sp.]|uniref:penicillin acylase family protein n=1 Tax=Longimicrobium sp. TaxID=2029185 RepID=UPI002E2FA776|nr:penicillin acylase family protein [Longimicrobium sp.]HEX6041035.1 penicillin acylase family protein [Longimicrobium sp.]